MQKRFAGIVLSAALASLPLTAGGQNVLQVAGPSIGDIAPDFTLPGATRYGLLANPVRLSDYRGSTVVLAFFYQARTKG